MKEDFNIQQLAPVSLDSIQVDVLSVCALNLGKLCGSLSDLGERATCPCKGRLNIDTLIFQVDTSSSIDGASLTSVPTIIGAQLGILLLSNKDLFF